MCATGLKSFKAASEQAASDRRARRHAAAAATPVGPVCLPSLWQNLCIGLQSPQSYPCSSMTAQLTLHQCNVIVEIE